MRLPAALCALAIAAFPVAAAAAPGLSGHDIYEQRCRGCHGGTAPADLALGPNLTGIVGTRAGSQSSGIHSREATDSGIVWDRDSLRAFLSVPRTVLPNTLMGDGIADPAELERVLDFLETLR
jgi:cytochrome c